MSDITIPLCRTQSAGCPCCMCMSTMEEVELVRVTSQEGVSVEEYENVSDYVDGFTPKPGDVEVMETDSRGSDDRSTSAASGETRTSLKDGEHYYIVPEQMNINLSTNKDSCDKPLSPKTAVDLEMDEESYLMPNPRRKPSGRSRKATKEKKGGSPLRKRSTESDVPDEEAPALPKSDRRKRQEDYATLDVKNAEEENIYTNLKESPAELPKRLLKRITVNSVLMFCCFLLCITVCSLLYHYVNSLEKKLSMVSSVIF